jgi:heme/copper-type cytochrome/quinol oxidase subunit 3
MKELLIELLIVAIFYFGLLYLVFDIVYKKLLNHEYKLKINRYIFYFFLGIGFHLLGEITGFNKKYIDLNKNKDLTNVPNMIRETVIVGAFYGFIFTFLEHFYFKESFNFNRAILIFILAAIIHVFGEYNGVNKWYYDKFYDSIKRW